MNKLIFSSCFLAGICLMGSCGGNSKESSSGNDSNVVLSRNEETPHASAEPSSSAHETAAETAPEIPSNGLPTVLDFSAVWCGPCQHMKPVFAELEEAYDGMVNFVTIDIDEYPGFATSFGVQAVPTFVFLNKEGKEVARKLGAMPRGELEQEINNLMK